jgi:hypothetical protein
MTGCDLQDRHSGLLVHRVMLGKYARGPLASDAHAVLPFSPADLEPTSRSNGASFAASIYSLQRCRLQLLYSRECRMQYCSSRAHRGGQLQPMLVRPHPPTPVVQVFFRSPAEVLVSKNLTPSGRMQYARRLCKISSAADFSWQTPPMPSLLSSRPRSRSKTSNPTAMESTASRGLRTAARVQWHDCDSGSAPRLDPAQSALRQTRRGL